MKPFQGPRLALKQKLVCGDGELWRICSGELGSFVTVGGCDLLY